VKKIVWVFLLVFCALFTATVYYKNPHVVEVNYYFGLDGMEFNVAALVLFTFFSGVIIGLLVMYWSVFKQKMRFSAEHRKLVKVEKEVESLRAMPLKSEV